MTSPSATAPPPPPPLPSSNNNNKICFNSQCKDSITITVEASQKRKGWRLRSGDHSDLCNRCSDVYEQGTFCETFHLEADGWRKCETCGKRVHCGCIVSAPSYVLLDVGGIECVVCTRKALSTAPNNMWSSSLLLSSQASERPKEQQVKNWNQMSTSYPGQWRQGHHLWNTGTQSDLQQRLSLEFDRPHYTERLMAGVRASFSANDKKVTDPSAAFNMYKGEDNDPIYARKSVTSDPCSTSTSLPSSFITGDSSPLLGGLTSNFSSANSSITPSQGQMAPPLPKQFPRIPHNINDATIEVLSGRHRVDAKARSQLLPRYWPRITDQELQQISGDSNSVITPLFEKMLSASDAGRIGRLVLPKKCAEAYFPPVFKAEGVPLKVQDVSGNEWVFQFRFWPNNNSRMYVLEGVTPCIQSMQLQAGDTVTFSRIDPEGKLLMGFRKATIGSSEQDVQTAKTGNDISTPLNGNKVASDSTANMSSTHGSQNTADGATLSKFDRLGFIQKIGSPTKSSQGSVKRRGIVLGSKNKRLRIDNEDSVELKISWEEAQDLLRPPPNRTPNIVVIDGLEIEEYEEAPVIGKPVIFTTNQAGESSQWAQCERCFKWRKLLVDALLPFQWTCSENKWDSERSSCSSAQEESMELSEVLILTQTGSKRSKLKLENSNQAEVSDGLDTLANLAILEGGNSFPTSTSQTTTRHPRHRPGCTCIVCIQPPSGKGPKHREDCMCNVCLTVKRRFKTLMLRRERKQSEKETINSSSITTQSFVMNNEGEVEDENEKKMMLASPLKAQIDLNIQPEREEEPSPKADATG